MNNDINNNNETNTFNKIKPFNFQNYNDTQEKNSYNNNNISVINESLVGKSLLPIEEEKEEESFSSVIKKNNLLFEEKDVSFMKLYCHLS